MIPVMKPWLGEDEARAAADVVASGWLAQGPRVAGLATVLEAGVDLGLQDV